MRRRKINNRYLSESIPSEASGNPMDAVDFATALKRFADEYLRGAMEVDVVGKGSGYTSVSLNHTAYLFRLMLENTEQNEVLNVKAELSESMSLFVTFRTPPSDEALAGIINTAKIAGFTVSSDNNELIFSAAIDSAAIIKIYALSKDEISDCLLKTIFL